MAKIIIMKTTSYVIYILSHTILFWWGNNRTIWLTWPDSLFCNLSPKYSMISLFYCPVKGQHPAVHTSKMKMLKFLCLTTPTGHKLSIYSIIGGSFVISAYMITSRVIFKSFLSSIILSIPSSIYKLCSIAMAKLLQLQGS